MKYLRSVSVFLSAAAICVALTGCGSRSVSVPLAETAMTSLTETLSLGTKYLGTLDYVNAILQYTAVIEEDPYNVEAYAGLYAAYVASGQTDEAEQVLYNAQEAIGDDGELVSNILDRANLIYENGGGLTPIQQLGEFYARDLDAENDLAEERAQRMRQIYNECIEKDPTNPEAYLALCLLYINNDDLEEAEKFLEEAEENGTDLQELRCLILENSDGIIINESDGHLTLGKLGCVYLENTDPDTEEPIEIPITVEIPADGDIDAGDITQGVLTEVGNTAATTIIEGESGFEPGSEEEQLAEKLAQEAITQGLAAMGDTPGMNGIMGDFGF